jgi:hypothetical protein
MNMKKVIPLAGVSLALALSVTGCASVSTLTKTNGALGSNANNAVSDHTGTQNNPGSNGGNTSNGAGASSGQTAGSGTTPVAAPKPVNVDPTQQKVVNTTLGHILVFVVPKPDEWIAKATAGETAAFMQSTDNNGKPTVPSFYPRKEGVTVISMTHAGTTYTVTVTVTK